jgi:predicted aldo/keto reductase-like oxidoreductase
VVFGKPDAVCAQYSWWKYAYEVEHTLDHDVRAVHCTQCAECESKCPQGIPVSSWMPVINSVLGDGKPWIMSV